MSEPCAIKFKGYNVYFVEDPVAGWIVVFSALKNTYPWPPNGKREHMLKKYQDNNSMIAFINEVYDFYDTTW